LQTRLHHYRFKTLTVPPFRTTQAQLQSLKDAYAEALMTPESIVRPVVDWEYQSVLTLPPESVGA
jgi:hypothetical protein